jgi:transcriptional antiterminator RfaH
MSSELLFLAQTKPRQDALAASHLVAQGYEVVAPRIPKIKPKRVRASTALDEPLFPGYVFLGPSCPGGSVASVRSTVGVRGLVQFAGQPARIRRQTLHCILDWVDGHLAAGPDAISLLCGIRPGMSVRVETGPFRDLRGLVSQTAGDRVTVLMEILGQEQRLAFAPWELSAD